MKRAAVLIAAFAGACSGDGAGPATPGEEPLIAFRLAYDQDAVDRIPVDFEGRTVFVAQHPLISDPDLVDVRIGRNEHQDLILDAPLTAEAGARLRRATARHIGQWIAVYYDGGIVSLPVIRGVIGERVQVLIPGPSEDEAERISEKVRARWPSRARTGR